MEGSDGEFTRFTVLTLKAFLKALSLSVRQHARTCCLCYRWPRNTFSPCARDFWSAEKHRHFFFPILHHLFPVNSIILANTKIANTTVVTFVPFLNSRLNFHCYTQREPTPTQKLARKWQLRPFVTSCMKDYEGHSLVQTSLAEPPNSTLHNEGLPDPGHWKLLPCLHSAGLCQSCPPA